MESEILQAYRQLRRLCADIRVQMGDRMQPEDGDDVSLASDDTGSLNAVVTELRDTVHTALGQANQVCT